MHMYNYILKKKEQWVCFKIFEISLEVWIFSIQIQFIQIALLNSLQKVLKGLKHTFFFAFKKDMFWVIRKILKNIENQ